MDWKLVPRKIVADPMVQCALRGISFAFDKLCFELKGGIDSNIKYKDNHDSVIKNK